jgi:hypothetical protein
MALSTPERVKVWAHAMRGPDGIGVVSKPDLQAAVNAVDDWVDDNQSSYNTALPTAFRDAASTNQKYFLMMWVLMRRMGRLIVEGD